MSIIKATQFGAFHSHYAERECESGATLRSLPHTHEQYEMMLMLRADSVYYGKNRTLKIESPGIILTPPNCRHSEICDLTNGYKRYCYVYTPDWFDELVDGRLDFGVEPFDDINFIPISNEVAEHASNIAETVHTLYQRWYDDDIGLHTLRLLSAALFSYISDALVVTSNGEQKGYISEVAEYIRRNPTGDLSIDRLAAIFYVSRSKLIGDFKRRYSSSIGEFVTAKRLEYARELLNSGESVRETAVRCGFSEASYFIKVFTGRYGVTPAVYRRGEK